MFNVCLCVSVSMQTSMGLGFPLPPSMFSGIGTMRSPHMGATPPLFNQSGQYCTCFYFCFVPLLLLLTFLSVVVVQQGAF